MFEKTCLCPLSRRGSVAKTTSAAYALYPPVPTNTPTPHGVTNTPTPPVIQQAVLGTGPNHAMLGIGSVQKDSNCGLGPRLWTYTSFWLPRAEIAEGQDLLGHTWLTVLPFAEVTNMRWWPPIGFADARQCYCYMLAQTPLDKQEEG